ncbi:hypothetical protein DSL72_005298 [Monilinia vaccinii-corymbosi]|uniref:Chromo domain-containing protein n=1 Tax=Monilinia vaccinii-corymbosi TaxID=61207 RepID=A0A8A3PET2_9HELO|nr:hypothetical protein DSL72_005298 [Monilinia vaccinii-corymbosi]
MSFRNPPRLFTSLEEEEISKISIESTDEEEYPSDHEYTVERIMAQKSENGQQLFLIRWMGFPEEESSWEPRRNILDKDILDAWKSRRNRESKGLDTPYDIGKLEALKKTAAESKARRDRLRREKRKRQGIVVSPHESDADDGERQAKIPRTGANIAALGSSEKSSAKQQEVQATRKSKGREPADSGSSSDEALFVNRLRKMTTVTSSPTKIPRVQKELQKHVTSQATASDTRETPAKEISSAVRGTPKTQGGLSLPQQNVFVGGKSARKPKLSLIKAAADPARGKRHFTKTSILRKAQLAGRALADAPPDLAALGGLIKPSEASSIRRLETVQESPSVTQNEDGNDRRISSAKSLHKQLEDPMRLPANPLHVSEMPWEDVQHIPYEKRSICFFFTRPQGCHNRSRCKYQHVDDPRLPIAPPPDGWAESQKLCFFYNSDGNCWKGDTCSYLHESGTNLPVSKPPSGRVASKPPTMVIPREAHMKSDNLITSEAQMTSDNIAPREARMIPENSDGPKLICCYWYNEQCSKGNDCKMAHSTDNDFPVAVKPVFGPAPCKYWQRGDCYSGTSCRFSHESTQDSRPVAYPSQVHTNTAGLGIPSEENPHPPQNNSKPAIFGEDDTIDLEIDTVADLLPPESNLVESAPLQSDGYPIDKTGQSTRTIVKTVTIASEAQPISLQFTSFPSDASDLIRAFASTETVKFDQLCTAQDFKLRYRQIQEAAYWQQNTDTTTADQAGCDTVNRVVQYLCLRKAGLVCISDTYIVLLYPGMAEEWKYLDVLSHASTGAKLKYLVFGFQRPLPNFTQPSTINQTSSRDLSHRDMMMKSFHHLDYERLVLEQKSKKVVNFCLLFLESANTILESITLWLRSCSRDSNIYNYQKPGSWDHFKKHAKAGVVLIHWSAIRLISDTDLIREMTAGVNFTFWCVEDSKSIVPFSSNRYYKVPKPELGQIAIRQLLPLGYAILLTPSFCVAEPIMALKFLKWYQKKLKSTITDSIKVLCCHELPKFLMRLLVAKVAEQQEFMKSHINDDLILANLDASGLSQEQCAARIDLYWLLCDMLSKDLPSHLSSAERDPSVETSQNPFFFAPSWIGQNDEKTLVSWFTGWAYCNLDKYRRFYVIGSGKSKKYVGIPGRLDEFEFPSTDQWYLEWRENDPEGQSSNHIIVNRWEYVFKSLGIQY